jgi:hypothetical protein
MKHNWGLSRKGREKQKRQRQRNVLSRFIHFLGDEQAPLGDGDDPHTAQVSHLFGNLLLQSTNTLSRTRESERMRRNQHTKKTKRQWEEAKNERETIRSLLMTECEEAKRVMLSTTASTSRCAIGARSEGWRSCSARHQEANTQTSCRGKEKKKEKEKEREHNLKTKE